MTKPPFSLDLFDTGEAYAVPLGDEMLWTGLIQSYLLALFGCELRTTPTPHVLKVGDRLKMIRVATRSLATEMVKFKTTRDGAVRSFPCDPVCFVAAGYAVTSLVLDAVPYPAWRVEPKVSDGIEVIAPLPSFASGMVAVDEADRFSLDPPSGSQSFGSEWCRFAASAFTKFRRLFSHVGLRSRLTLGGSGVYRSPHSIPLGLTP